MRGTVTVPLWVVAVVLVAVWVFLIWIVRDSLRDHTWNAEHGWIPREKAKWYQRKCGELQPGLMLVRYCHLRLDHEGDHEYVTMDT